MEAKKHSNKVSIIKRQFSKEHDLSTATMEVTSVEEKGGRVDSARSASAKATLGRQGFILHDARLREGAKKSWAIPEGIEHMTQCDRCGGKFTQLCVMHCRVHTIRNCCLNNYRFHLNFCGSLTCPVCRDPDSVTHIVHHLPVPTSETPALLQG